MPRSRRIEEKACKVERCGNEVQGSAAAAKQIEQLKIQLAFMERELSASRANRARPGKAVSSGVVQRPPLRQRSNGEKRSVASDMVRGGRGSDQHRAVVPPQRRTAAVQTAGVAETWSHPRGNIHTSVLSFVEESFDDVLALLQRHTEAQVHVATTPRMDMTMDTAATSALKVSPLSIGASAHRMIPSSQGSTSITRHRPMPLTPIVPDSAGGVKKLLSFKTPLVHRGTETPPRFHYDDDVRKQPSSQVSPFALARIGRSSYSGALMAELAGDLYRCLLRLLSGPSADFVALLPILERFLNAFSDKVSEYASDIPFVMRICARIGDRCGKCRSLLLGQKVASDHSCDLISKGSERIIVAGIPQEASISKKSSATSDVEDNASASPPCAALEACTRILLEVSSPSCRSDSFERIAASIIAFFDVIARRAIGDGVSLRKMERLFTRGILRRIIFGAPPNASSPCRAVDLMTTLLRDNSGAFPDNWVTDEIITGTIPRPWSAQTLTSFSSDVLDVKTQSQSQSQSQSHSVLGVDDTIRSEAPIICTDSTVAYVNADTVATLPLRRAILRMCSSVIAAYGDDGIAWLLQKPANASTRNVEFLEECDDDDGTIDGSALSPDPSILLWLLDAMYEYDNDGCSRTVPMLECFYLFVELWPHAVSKGVWSAINPNARVQANHILSCVLIAMRRVNDPLLNSRAQAIFDSITF